MTEHSVSHEKPAMTMAAEPEEKKLEEKRTELENTQYQINQILNQYNQQESNIPLTNEYWSLCNKYRMLLVQQNEANAVAAEKQAKENAVKQAKLQADQQLKDAEEKQKEDEKKAKEAEHKKSSFATEEKKH